MSRGFTLAELAVVLAVVGLLVALILPAVSASREAARAAGCANNLKQFGLALADFEASRGAFPGAVRAYGGETAGYHMHSPHVHLLPYLGEAPLHERVDPAARLMARQVRPFGRFERHPVAPFVCPSDGADPPGGTNYRVNTGSAAYPQWGPGGRAVSGEAGGFGPFRLWTDLPLAAVRDGVSQTVAVGEKLRGRAPAAFDPATDAWMSGLWGFTQPRYPPGADLLAVCLSGAPADLPPAFATHHAGADWEQAGFQFTWYNHAAPPNAATPDCDVLDRALVLPMGGVYRATSAHPGGVNAALCDGAVRFVGDAVDGAVWSAAGTTDGGEVVAGF